MVWGIPDRVMHKEVSWLVLCNQATLEYRNLIIVYLQCSKGHTNICWGGGVEGKMLHKIVLQGKENGQAEKHNKRKQPGKKKKKNGQTHQQKSMNMVRLGVWHVDNNVKGKINKTNKFQRGKKHPTNK